MKTIIDIVMLPFKFIGLLIQCCGSMVWAICIAALVFSSI